MTKPLKLDTHPAVLEQFSLFVRGETDSLDKPTRDKETLVNILWAVTTAMPTGDCEALGVPAGTPYGVGVRTFIVLVAPDQATEIIGA